MPFKISIVLAILITLQVAELAKASTFERLPIACAKPAVPAPVVRKLVVDYMMKNLVPGISVAVSCNGSIVFAKGFGTANLEDKVPVTSATVFVAASTLKLLTATAVMQLQERGRIELNNPIQQYCAAYPEKQWKVTVRDLLRHQAGIPPEIGADVFNREHFNSVDEAVRAFSNLSLSYEPRADARYANDGYTLLACAIEGASGLSFSDYLRKNILAPANMTSTQSDDGYRIIAHRARGYLVRTTDNTKAWDGLWKPGHLALRLDTPANADAVDPTRNIGASGYVTSPTDLLRFVAAYDDGRLLNQISKNEMETRQFTAVNKPTNFGLGWVIGESSGKATLHLFGSVWNGSSSILFFPREHFAVSISTNLEFQQPDQLADQIAEQYLISGGTTRQ